MAKQTDNLTQWDELIRAKAAQYGLPADLVRSVIYQESRGNAKAVSPVGAAGLMQLMPGTAKELGVKDPFDPEQNIDGGVRYLKQQISKFGLVGGVAAYNAGPGNVQKHKGVPPFKETQGYVKDVLGRLGAWDSMTGGMQAPQPAPQSSPRGPFDQMMEPFNNLRRSLGMEPVDLSRPREPAVKFDPMGNELDPKTPWYLQPLEAARSVAKQPLAENTYGAARTAFKGANQAAAKILDTGARALRDLTPFGLPNTMQDLARTVGIPVKEDSMEAKLAALTRKINPFNALTKLTGQMNQQAQAEPPTAFEQNYDRPIWQTQGGTTLIPSGGELVRSMGTYAPEMLLAASMPGAGLGQAVTQRFGVQSPVVAKNLQQAVQQSFGGLTGGTAKGQPGEAALNTALFPAMTMAGAGMGYYGREGAAALRRELPAVKEVLKDQSGAVRPFAKQPIPTPEAPETIAMQMEAMRSGRAKAVLVTPGSQMPEVPKGYLTTKTEVGTWIHDPAKLKTFEIKRDVLRGEYGKHLGHLEPKGPGTTQVVTATQGGIEAKTSLASPANAQAQAKVLQGQFPAAKISVDGPEAAGRIIANRATPQKMTFEQYAISKGHSPTVPAFPDLHRQPRRPGKATIRNTQARVQSELDSWGGRQAALKNEYQAKIKSGELIEPTNLDRLQQRALGEGETAEAAKRVLQHRMERQMFQQLRFEIEQASPGKRIFQEAGPGMGGDMVVSREASTFPVPNLGTKKDQLSILNKFLAGKKLTAGQRVTLDEMRSYVRAQQNVRGTPYAYIREQAEVGRTSGGADVLQFPPPAGAGGSPPTEPPPPGPVMRERGFTQTVREAPNTPGQVAAGVSGEYQPLKSQESMAVAQKAVEIDPVKAREIVLNAREYTPEIVRMGHELMRVHNAQGDYDMSIRIADKMAEMGTKQGQTIQAYADYARLGPEGILRLAQKTVRQAREEMPKAKVFQFERQVKEAVKQAEASGQAPDVEAIREMIARKLKLPSVTPEFAQRITQRAAQIEQMADGYEKSFATAQMLRDIGELVPASKLRKISTFQTIAQLFNPKTWTRNLVGNAAFTAGENVKDVVAAGLDRGVGLITGQRTKSLAGGNQYKEQFKGFMQGLYEGAREAWNGIDTTRIADKFEMNDLKRGFLQGQTFRGKIMGTIERTLGVALRAPDRAFYRAAVNKSLAEQMALAKVANPTDEMIAQAHFEGLYKTFQDESAAARVFVGLKRAMNLGKEFGAGDVLLKYPKTPGNILSRSLEYSPAGFVKSMMEVGRAAMGHGFDQRAFVDSTARALIGSGGLTALGYGLSNIGVLRNTAPRDPDLRAVEATEGRTQSQMNVSALRRYIMSGFDPKSAEWKPEDTLATYDWAVPLSTSLSLGARAQEKGVEDELKLGTQLDNLALASAGFEGAIDTLGEQPMIKTLTSLARGQGMAKSLMNIAKGVTASFTPTMLKQVEQLTDNTRRDTFDPNPVLQALNMAQGKTPFADQLPARMDPFGRPMENYQGGTNSILNVMLNPAFMAKYRPTPESKMVVDLYRSTSDARVVPIVVENKFKWNGIPYEMNAKQRNVMQKWLGERTQKTFAALAASPGFQQMPDEGKVKLLTEYLTKLRGAARASIFLYEVGQRPLVQRPVFMAEAFRKNKLSPDQIKGVFRDMAMFQAFNQGVSK